MGRCSPKTQSPSRALRPLPSHLSFQGLCLLHLRSPCWGPALDILQARPSPELWPLQAPQVPTDSSQSCSCTRALQSWTHLSPSSTEARPHLLGSLGLTTEPKQPASSCSPVALHSVWLLLGALTDLHPSPSSTLSPEALRLLPFLTASQALGWAHLSPPLPSHLWPSPPGADAPQALSNLSYPLRWAGLPAPSTGPLHTLASGLLYPLLSGLMAHMSTFESQVSS